MKGEVFVLTTEPPESVGGMERFLGYLAGGLRERGYGVRIFHRANAGPAALREARFRGRWGRLASSVLQGYYVGRAARRALHPGVRLVLSNATVGWFPVGSEVKQAHFYHGTYRGQADAVRRWISRRGYLRLKWWDSMTLERWSGRGKLCLCNSEQTCHEIRRFFGYQGCVVHLPLDTGHFRPLDRLACRRALGWPPDRAVGLFVGSAYPQKGFSSVRALLGGRDGMDWVLALRGEVPAAVRDDPRIRVIENCAYELLPALYGAADFVVSASRYEPFGYVVAEALACGTPVIATPGGASRLLLQETPLARLLVSDPDDVGMFRQAMQEVLTAREHYREAVLTQVRPRLEQMLGLDRWWSRFLKATELGDGR